MRLNRMLALFAVGASLTFAMSPASQAGGQKWFEKAVKKVEGTFTPAEAKPGQTVTFTVTLELNEGYHTYPTVQKDQAAAGMVNVIKFPATGSVIFVGSVTDPKDPKTKAEPTFVPPITALRYYEGKVVYTRQAVVSPKAAVGPTAMKLSAFKLSICDKDNCFAPKDVPVEAKLKVLEGSVEVEAKYADEVAKALAAK
jgi:plastocyanin